MNQKAIRGIPLEKFFDLKVDFAFKQLFGNEKNKNQFRLGEIASGF